MPHKRRRNRSEPGVFTSSGGFVRNRAQIWTNGSHPERLRFGKGGIGSLRLLEHGRNPRLLAAPQLAKESLPASAAVPLGTRVLTVAELLQQLLVHCDVVELAERVLKLL